ncbi:MAG: MarR family transcriptional regulator [Gemmatimonadetes bacterium]|nr:MarR family transcriptional regulator [Gemmatimonadota bacterium]MBL0179077.1 MarR family transcriptional regulator [Gemmatimonadota bacterium]
MQTTSRADALRLVRALVTVLDRSAREVEATTGITNAQLFVLRRLAAGGNPSVNELAERLHARQNTVSALLKRLVAAGLVMRARAADDGRRAVLSLTPAGRRLVRRAPPAPLEQLLGALEGMSATEVRALSRGLAPLVQRLGLAPESAPVLFEDR